jgi:non-ribosomal peptide synthetase component F
MVYNLDLFEPATIDSMMARFVVLLESIVQDPNMLIDRLEILTPDERNQQEHIQQTWRNRLLQSRYKNQKRHGSE